MFPLAFYSHFLALEEDLKKLDIPCRPMSFNERNHSKVRDTYPDAMLQEADALRWMKRKNKNELSENFWAFIP